MSHPAFELIRHQTIDALKIRVEEYRHIKTGAQHIHLAADNNENVFLVALRTVPHDSSGVAHILEHTALCGSQKYPVRDPFFMMVRRSLNTFMNAFTSSDWTAYPFASQNTKDFNNLLDVYLDAVFFSRLDELDFAQEGHRLEFAETDNPESELVYKGVVFNEMKGAMSSVSSQLWHTLCKYLYPTTTYHYNSGGEPEDIPNLSYQNLLDFYRTHYHPSNAIFMTYGDIAAEVHQQKFEEQALHKFAALNTIISVPDEKRYHAPIKVEEAYPIDEADEEELDSKNHLVMAWLLGKTTNLDEALEAQLLSNILLDNSASPLQQALETSELGQAPSPLCGLDDSSREMAFVCGLEGCKLSDIDKIETLILSTLQKVAAEGVPKEQIEASLHQLELSQREVGGDGYPYGLQLILTGLTSATHRGDAIALLDMDAALTSLNQKIQDPEFIQQLTQKWLLDNPHCVRLTLRPDTQMRARIDAAEKQRLAQIKLNLSASEREKIISQSHALQARQLQQDDDESILPKVGLEDIPKQLHYIAGSQEQLHQYPLRRYAAGTTGLVYQQITYKLPALNSQQISNLSLYCMCLTELGLGTEDYLSVQRRQAEVVGSISAFSSLRGAGDDVQVIDGYLTLSAKALERNSQAMNKLMHDTLTNVRFDEVERIRELVAQARARREQSITGSGHSLAMTAACAGMSPAAKVAHELGGLVGIAALKTLDNKLDNAQALADFAQELQEIHQLVLAAPKQFCIVGEEEHLENYRTHLANSWQASAPSDQFVAFNLAPVNSKVAEAWIANTQVNFCAKAYPSVPADHPDAAALTVLGGFLRNGFLHRAIREQGGAYGGGASQDNNSAAFRFYSYRDPRLAETLDDFDASLVWLQNHAHQWQSVEEAILGVISSIDKPGSPAGEAKSTFQAELFGRTRAKREAFRNRTLAVTLADLQRVGREYLDPAKASIALVTHQGQKEVIERLGLSLKTL
jgi:presequence protease